MWGEIKFKDDTNRLFVFGAACLLIDQYGIISCWTNCQAVGVDLLRGCWRSLPLFSHREPTSSWRTTATLNWVRGAAGDSVSSRSASPGQNCCLSSLTSSCCSCCFSPHHHSVPSLFSPFLLLLCLWNVPSLLWFLSPADFGVSAQITATLAKRKSFIGTPYWLVLFFF